MNLWIVTQAVIFQAVWLSAVLGGNQWIALTLSLLVLHFLCSPSPKQDLTTLPIALFGIGLDMALIYFGVFYFERYPFWLLILWFAFVLNFAHSLSFIRKLHLCWKIFAGALGGSYAYILSWKLGAVSFPLGIEVTAAILLTCWAVLLPILITADSRVREYCSEH